MLKRTSLNYRSTLSPKSLIGGFCPGTMQSGPAASTIASVPNPLPIGSGCCNSQSKKITKITSFKVLPYPKEKREKVPHKQLKSKHYHIKFWEKSETYQMGNNKTETNLRPQKKEEKKTNLHDRESIIGKRVLRYTKNRGIMNFRDGFCTRRSSPWNIFL